MSRKDTRFDCSSIRNGPLLILWMSGDLSHDPERQLEQCWLDAQDGNEVNFVFLDMSKLTGVATEATEALANFQQRIRDADIELRICGLADEVKEDLAKRGVLRHGEMIANLKEALATLGKARILAQSHTSPEKKAA